MIVIKCQIEYTQASLNITNLKKKKIIMSSCLLEASSIRKNKISLTDYNYQKDIQNRLLLAKLTLDDLRVLEEILYSSLTIPVSKLANNLDLDAAALLLILDNLLPTGLFTLKDNTLQVNKEMRKYFEFQIEKLEDDFQPNMEFLQNLLKKIPIHVLPIWYSVPRTSNNIFESLIERHLLTPQIFQRYIAEVNFGEPALKQIIDDVYHSKKLEVSAQDIMDKYSITRDLFEEYMLHLEFSFICCLTYRKEGNAIKEVVTPFHEWKEYTLFLRNSETPSIKETEKVSPTRTSEFSFVEDLAIILEEAQKRTLTEDSLLPLFPDLSNDPSIYKPYFEHLLTKLTLVRFIDRSSDQIVATSVGKEWLNLSLDRQSLYFYRHPLNKIISQDFSSELYTEKSIREAERSITRVLNKEWVLFEDYLKGCISPLNEESIVSLKKTGRNWKYALPIYTHKEQEFLYATIFEWLPEAGLVQTGSFDGKPCFRVTSLGCTLFGR
jgi:predicted transcriptional regulator